MNFKKRLIEKAEQINIQKEMDQVIENMDKFANYREYFIKLYNAHTEMVIGRSSMFSRNESEFFVPNNTNGEEYTNLFIKELKQLGFNDKDISVETIKNKAFDLYTITVRW